MTKEQAKRLKKNLRKISSRVVVEVVMKFVNYIGRIYEKNF